ncbi:hypothetical protein D3C73_984210 [compost metagenome]
MDREGYIIVTVPVDAVTVPAVPQVEIVHTLQIFLQLLRIVRQPQLAEPAVHQHIEEQPVAVMAGMGIHLIQPAVQLLLLFRRERRPDSLRDSRQGEAEHGHLHQPLVIIGHFTPILGMVRIGAVPDTIQHQLP